MGNSDHGATCRRVGGDDGDLRPCHCIFVYSIESRLIRRVMETQTWRGFFMSLPSSSVSMIDSFTTGCTRWMLAFSSSVPCTVTCRQRPARHHAAAPPSPALPWLVKPPSSQARGPSHHNTPPSSTSHARTRARQGRPLPCRSIVPPKY